MEERRSNGLPCGHRFVYIADILPDNRILLKCCSCSWQMIREGAPRKTDMSHKEFAEMKKNWGEG